VVYDSHIVDACLRVPGVVAVHGLRFGIVPPPPPMVIAPFAATPVVLIQPHGPPLPAPFGAGFDPAQLFDPLVLAWRLGMEKEDLSDPVRLANRITVVPPPPPPSTTVAPTPVPLPPIDPGPRHVPGEGRFYSLANRNLHVEAEVARHVF
jgi:hypothetical protein